MTIYLDSVHLNGNCYNVMCMKTEMKLCLPMNSSVPTYLPPTMISRSQICLEGLQFIKRAVQESQSRGDFKARS